MVFSCLGSRVQDPRPCQQGIYALWRRLRPRTPLDATLTRLADRRGLLYTQIGEQDVRIADEAFTAWLMDGRQKTAYSAADGGGGYENEEQSLRLYDGRARTQRTVLSANDVIDTVSAITTPRGRQSLRVEMRDDGLGASHVAVGDPRRGPVDRCQQVKLVGRHDCARSLS